MKTYRAPNGEVIQVPSFIQSKEEARSYASIIRPDLVAKPEAPVPEMGVMDDIGAAANRGFQNLQIAGNVLGQEAGILSPETASSWITENIAEREATPASEGVQQGLQDIVGAETFGQGLAEAVTNPRALIAVTVESLISQGPGLVAAGAAAATGAGVPVAAGILGASSLASEYANTIVDSAQDQGFDVNTPEGLQGFFADEEAMSEARERGLKRGIPIGAFDAVSLGLAGKGVSVARGIVKAGEEGASTARKTAGNVLGAVAEIGMQAGAGAAGEASAQLVSEGEISSPGMVALEAAAEILPGAVETVIAGVAKQKDGSLDRAETAEETQARMDETQAATQPAGQPLQIENRPYESPVDVPAAGRVERVGKYRSDLVRDVNAAGMKALPEGVQPSAPKYTSPKDGVYGVKNLVTDQSEPIQIAKVGNEFEALGQRFPKLADAKAAITAEYDAGNLKPAGFDRRRSDIQSILDVELENQFGVNTVSLDERQVQDMITQVERGANPAAIASYALENKPNVPIRMDREPSPEVEAYRTLPKKILSESRRIGATLPELGIDPETMSAPQLETAYQKMRSMQSLPREKGVNAFTQKTELPDGWKVVRGIKPTSDGRTVVEERITSRSGNLIEARPVGEPFAKEVEARAALMQTYNDSTLAKAKEDQAARMKLAQDNLTADEQELSRARERLVRNPQSQTAQSQIERSEKLVADRQAAINSAKANIDAINGEVMRRSDQQKANEVLPEGATSLDQEELANPKRQAVEKIAAKVMADKVKQLGLDPNVVKIQLAEMGQGIEGSYNSAHKIITVNIDMLMDQQTAKQFDKPAVKAYLSGIIDHEIIHALVDLKKISRDEFAALRKMVTDTQRIDPVSGRKVTTVDGKPLTFLEFARSRYAEMGLSQEALVEEAVSEAFRSYSLGHLNLAGKPKGIFERIVDMFRRFGNTMNSTPSNRKLVKDLFDSIKSGDRAKMQIKSPYVTEPQFTTNKSSLGASRTGDVTQTTEFKRWFKGSKVVDENGNPLVLYRGGDGRSEGFLNAEPNDGYAVFVSPNPHLAATYAGSGADPMQGSRQSTVTPIYVRGEKLIEFPTKMVGGYRTFDKFGFDRQAKQLQPGEVLVVRGVVDAGPRGSNVMDPDQLWSFSSDVYAFGKGTSVKSKFNSGTFDGSNPDIRLSLAAKADQMPTLRTDNPGGNWLESKKRWSREAMANAEPGTYTANLGISNVTGYFSDPVALNPKALSGVKGATGEESYRESSPKLNQLKEAIAAEGYNPSPILIHVREDGTPFIVEGNHRVAEAIQSGRKSIDAEIKYLRGAEEVDGPLNPEKLPLASTRGTSKIDQLSSDMLALAEQAPDDGDAAANILREQGFNPNDPQEMFSLIDRIKDNQEKRRPSSQAPSSDPILRDMIADDDRSSWIDDIVQFSGPAGMKRLWLTVRTKLIDSSAPLGTIANAVKQMSDDTRHMLHEMSSMSAVRMLMSARGITEQVMNRGYLAFEKLPEGGTRLRVVSKDADGNPLPSIDSILTRVYKMGLEQTFQRMLMLRRHDYIETKRAQQKPAYDAWKRAGGKKSTEPYVTPPSGFNDEQLAALRREVQSISPDVMVQFEEMAAQVNVIMTKNAEAMQAAGLISGQELDAFTDSAYIPYYTMKDDDLTGGTAGRMKFIRNSTDGVTKYTKRKGGEKGTENRRFLPLKDALARNLEWTTASILKNDAYTKTIRDMLEYDKLSPEPKALIREEENPGDRTVQILVDGKPKYYSIGDPLFYEALTALGAPARTSLNPIIGGPIRMLRYGVTNSPPFIMANLLRDSVSSWVISGEKITPVVGTLKGFYRALRYSNTDETVQKLREGGIGLGYDNILSPENLAKKYGEEPPKNAISRMFFAVKDGLEHASAASDLASRVAIYDAVIKRGGSDMEALSIAREYMNYSRRGSNESAAMFISMIPFLNARIQGLDVLGRVAIGSGIESGSDVDSRQRMRTFWMRMGLLTAAGGMYAALVSGEDWYEEVAPEVRDNNYLIKVGDSVLAIPIAFEVGLLTKTLPEYIYRTFISGDEDKRSAMQAAMRAVTGTLGINPIPQALLPYIEAKTNYSIYRGREIVPRSLQDLDPKEQYTANTSALAKGISNAIDAVGVEMSPMKIQYMIQGYTGTLGTYGLMMIDTAARGVGLADKTPAASIVDYPVIRRFFKSPEGGYGPMNDFYDLYSQIDRTYTTMTELKDRDDFDRAREIQKDNRQLLAMRKTVNSLYQRVSKVTSRIREIEANQRLTPIQRRDRIKALEIQRNKTLAQVAKLRARAFN